MGIDPGQMCEIIHSAGFLFLLENKVISLFSSNFAWTSEIPDPEITQWSTVCTCFVDSSWKTLDCWLSEGQKLTKGNQAVQLWRLQTGEKWKCSSVQWMKKSIYCFPWLLLHCAALIGCCDARNRVSVGKWQPVKIEVEKGFMRSSQRLCGSVGGKNRQRMFGSVNTQCSGR